MPRATTFYQGLISATSKKEAVTILDFLTRIRLVAGGNITVGESHYWWEGKRVRKKYWNISIFCPRQNTKQIIVGVRKLHADKVPVIAFVKIAKANADFLKWIAESCRT